jgi:inner membrane protein
MSGRTHALVPAGLVSVVFQGDPLVTLTAALAGLAPDIDEPQSVIGQRCWLIAWWIKYVFGHRTVSHSFVMVVLVALLGFCVALPTPIIVALGVGVLSHVVLDAYSGGVMLWWPSKTRWVLGRYRVYGLLDRVLMFSGVVLTIWMLIDRMQREMGTLHVG